MTELKFRSIPVHKDIITYQKGNQNDKSAYRERHLLWFTFCHNGFGLRKQNVDKTVQINSTIKISSTQI